MSIHAPRGPARLQRASWTICALASLAAGGLLIGFGVAIDAPSLAVALAMMGFLGGAYLVYGHRRPAPMIHNLCGALGVIAWSGAMAGIISLAGLRYGAPLIDAELTHLDRALGIDTPAIVRLVAANPFWAWLLGIAYESSFPLLGAVAVLLTATRRFEQLWTLALVFAVTVLACTTISVFIPARGAFAHFAYPAELLQRLPAGSGIYHLAKFDYYRHAPDPVISFSQVQGVVTFPSFHCCLALMTIAACWGIRWLAPLALAWNVLVIISTLPIGGHYATDLPAGAAVWLAATLLAGTAARTAAFSWPRRTVHGFAQPMAQS